MESPLAELDKALAEMRGKIAEHEDIVRQAQQRLNDALETGALVQQRIAENDPDRQKDLDSISGCYEEIQEIIAEHTCVAERLRELEQFGDRLRTTLLPYYASGRCE